MTHKKLIWLLAAAMTLLTSCNDDRLLQEDSGRMPIRFSACDLTLTRADDGLNNNGTFFDGSTSIDFKIAVDGRNYTYSTSAANTAMTSTSPAYYPIDGTTSVKVQAYYPADKMQYATSAQTFTVASDQTTAANYKASDLMYGVPAANGTTVGSGTWNGLDANGKVVPTTDPVPLVFTHKMVKIKVVVTPSGSTVNKVELKNIKRSIDFDPTDGTPGTAAVASDAVTTITMYDASTTSTLTTTALIPNQSIANTVDFLTITTSDHTLNYRLPAEVTFDAGKQYIYNVTVNTDQITVTSNITDWGTETYTHGDGLAFYRPIMPIEYLVGTTNMAATSDDVVNHEYIATTHKMASGNTPQETAYFRHSTAVDKFSHVSVVEPNGVSVGNYHLARTKEWMSILPPYWVTNTVGGTLTISGSNGDRIEFGTNVQNTNKQESAAWGAVWNGSSYTYQVDEVFKNDYFCPSGTTIGYGLRFKDNTTGLNCKYTCAFRYEYKTLDASVGGGASLTIQSKYVGRNQDVTITTISDEDWWTSSTDVISIVFPTTGIAWPDENNYDYPSGTYSSSVINDKNWGWFRSRDEESSTQGYTIIFQDTRVYGNNTSRKAYSIPVRLFRDAE